MCGICGYINLDKKPAKKDIIEVMIDSIKHRGPDFQDFYIYKYCALGHSRLSIIDLSINGSQPMTDVTGRYVITYNGEIYNFKEIKKDLLIRGYKFNSKTDTEIVMYAIIEWGYKAIKMFNGMFAFAFFDKKKEEILLARDRYGIKPLYYAKQNKIFLFSSEQKAILSNKFFNKKINYNGIYQYFSFQNIFTDDTFIQDINLLPPGHCLVLKNNETKLLKYWDYNFKSEIKIKNENDYIDELDFLFRQAVQRQLVGDVELGAYLSGGIDSSAITAIASKHFKELKSFTCGFDLSSVSGIELSYDEREKAEAISAIFKTEHYQMILKSGDMERSLSPLAFSLEEPRVGSSYPNYFMAKLASKFVKVALSGIGGDELFCGYPWRYYSGPISISFDDFVDNYFLYWQRLMDEKTLKRMLDPISMHIKNFDSKEIFKNVFPKIKKSSLSEDDFINYSLYFEAKTFLHGLFVVEDKLSMAHGLETRVPFMDNDLVDFAMRCPPKLKLKNIKQPIFIDENENENKPNLYFKKTNDGKQILRKVMNKYLLSEITKSPKKGFTAPDASWFKGESIDFVKKVVSDKNSKIFDILDKRIVNNLVNDHINGKENKRLFIWSILNVNEWLNQNF